MTMATKFVSSFAVFFILFLFTFEVPEADAQDTECLVEYGGDVGFPFCAPLIYPPFCYTRCRSDKGSKGGVCVWGEGNKVKCLCDFCHDNYKPPFDQKILSGI
ncbi:Defensin-like protein 193 [Hirschfeldia incana]|nr:Defensin-like protein 193 [Hirschfeldia incana]